jgi:hypothetical protein
MPHSEFGPAAELVEEALQGIDHGRSIKDAVALLWPSWRWMTILGTAHCDAVLAPSLLVSSPGSWSAA